MPNIYGIYTGELVNCLEVEGNYDIPIYSLECKVRADTYNEALDIFLNTHPGHVHINKYSHQNVCVYPYCGGIYFYGGKEIAIRLVLSYYESTLTPTLEETYLLKIKHDNRFLAPLFQRGSDIAVGKGWHKIVLDLDARLKEIYPNYTITQVKEKFGSLRYYVDSVPTDVYEKFHEEIRAAEKLSDVTCEQCGEIGKIRDNNGWLKTLCDTCNKVHL